MSLRPRRSALYMPGSNPRALEKAKTLPADVLILDLEDSVAPEAKETARAQVLQTVRGGGFGNREILIRINAMETPWGAEDLTVARAAGADGVLVPKVSAPDDLQTLVRRLETLGAGEPLGIWVMMETPRGILNAGAIAATAIAPRARLAGLVMGTNDLSKETRARIVPGRAPMRAWLMTCVAAARGYGLDILDGVYNDIADAEGFERECLEARDLGFDGKTLIHPSQIDPCNRVFSPTPAELDEARKILAAFALPENRGKGVIKVDGRMVERLHAEMARRIVAVADAGRQND
ncbi:MAG TPA: CoA ester lyase [Xanthobacteraceae bacterium]|nr:CoA ester lyase [Xanthobacteraceae bacterium]